MRALPPDLVEAVRRAHGLETLAVEAGTNEQRRHARQALNSILLAAVRAGWQKADLAPLLGVARQTVTNRVAEAQALYGDHSPALLIDPPLGPPPSVADELGRPVEERERLTRTEAAALVGRNPATIRNWYLGGLLPHTRVVHSTRYLFLRAEVLRVAASEQYRNHGVDHGKARVVVRRERMRDRLA